MLSLQTFEMKTDLQSASHPVLIACDLFKPPGSLSCFFVEESGNFLDVITTVI